MALVAPSSPIPAERGLEWEQEMLMAPRRLRRANAAIGFEHLERVVRQLFVGDFSIADDDAGLEDVQPQMEVVADNGIDQDHINQDNAHAINQLNITSDDSASEDEDGDYVMNGW